MFAYIFYAKKLAERRTAFLFKEMPFLSDYVQAMCILTSKRVLHALFAGQNYYYYFFVAVG